MGIPFIMPKRPALTDATRPSLIGIANYLISLGEVRGAPEDRAMNHMRVQKLAYLAYGHHLVLKDDVLCDEAPQIWTHGPGFLSLFYALQHHRGAVDTLIRTPFETPTLEAHPVARAFLDAVEERYMHHTTHALAEIAHGPGSAWKQAAAEHDFRCPAGTVIAERHLRAGFAALGL